MGKVSRRREEAVVILVQASVAIYQALVEEESALLPSLPLV